MPDEYNIRQPEDEESRGPFTLEKLISLVDADQVTPDTLVYDNETEQWTAISDNPELKNAIFPVKETLVLKPKSEDDMDLLNLGESEIPEISVHDMLSAAEGTSEETSHLKAKAKWESRAAELSRPILASIMFLSAFTFCYPSWQIVQKVIEDKNYMLILQNPLVIVGAADLFFAICVFLAVTEIYQVIRFRAMAGLGYFGFIYWAAWQAGGDQNSLYLMISIIALSIGIYICTITLRFFLMLFASIMALAGIIVYAWLEVLSALFQ